MDESSDERAHTRVTSTQHDFVPMELRKKAASGWVATRSKVAAIAGWPSVMARIAAPHAHCQRCRRRNMALCREKNNGEWLRRSKKSAPRPFMRNDGAPNEISELPQHIPSDTRCKEAAKRWA